MFDWDGFIVQAGLELPEPYNHSHRKESVGTREGLVDDQYRALKSFVTISRDLYNVYTNVSIIIRTELAKEGISSRARGILVTSNALLDMMYTSMTLAHSYATSIFYAVEVLPNVHVPTDKTVQPFFIQAVVHIQAAVRFYNQLQYVLEKYEVEKMPPLRYDNPTEKLLYPVNSIKKYTCKIELQDVI